jgi:hypothetical protein
MSCNINVLLILFALLGIVSAKSYEECHIAEKSFFRYQKMIKPNPNKPALLSSFVIGNKKLPNEISMAFKKTGSFHMLSPSGFHLTCILSPLQLLKSSKLTLIILMALCFACPFIPGLMALKRVVFISTFSKCATVRKSILLLIIFVLELILFQNSLNTYSFLLSMLFLSILFSDFKFIQKFLLFSFAGYVCMIIFEEHGYLWASIFSIIPSIIFNIIFPFWFLSYFFNLGNTHEIFLEKTILLFTDLIKFLANTSDLLPNPQLSMTFIIILIVLVLSNTRIRIILILLCLNVSNLNLESKLNLSYHRKFEWRQSFACYYLYEGFWYNSCPKKNQAGNLFKKFSSQK